MKSKLILSSLVWTVTLAASGCGGGGRTNPALVPNQETNRSAASVQASGDVLYVGDGSDNTVKRFGATSGTYLDAPTPFITQTSSGTRAGMPIIGPRGLLSVHQGNLKNSLLLANQNVNQSDNGTILNYNGTTGTFLGELVPFPPPNSPVAPRGIVLTNFLFVASDEGDDQSNGNGKLRAYTISGHFVPGHRFPPPPNTPAPSPAGHFHPRAVVIGPDGLLYVSNAPNDPGLPGQGSGGGLGGQVLRYNPMTGDFVDVFASDTDVPGHDFNRPEGLVFGPDGNLYVTSFAQISSPPTCTPINGSTDKILIFAGPGSGTPGAYLNKIDLDTGEVDQSRAFAQALLFGPGGFLYVPINGPGLGYPCTTSTLGPSTGEVRKYNVTPPSNSFVDLVKPYAPPLQPMQQPWYLTFGNTDPATLNYTSH